MPEPEPKRVDWTRLGGLIALLAVVLGLLSDTTSLVGNKGVRDAISAALPYGSTLLAIAMAAVAYRENRRLKAAEELLERRAGLGVSIMRRLVRVLGSAQPILAVANVEQSRLQPLFDELVGNLPPSFRAHHKFSIARPNADGTFTLMATRGMDPTSVQSIQSRASWKTGRSFYASLLNDPQRPEYRWFSVTDTAYVDTRPAGNSAARPTSSSSHLLIALRDDDTYADLPRQTIGIVSIGIPKGMELDESAQQELFLRVLPTAKAIEAVLIAESMGTHE